MVSIVAGLPAGATAGLAERGYDITRWGGGEKEKEGEEALNVVMWGLVSI
jgi:hypothetical protein